MKLKTKSALLVSSIIVLILMSSVTMAWAKTRGSYLLEFAKANETPTGGFTNTPTPTARVTEQATYANLYLLYKFGGTTDFDDFSTREWLREEITLNALGLKLKETYFGYAALNLMGEELNTTDQTTVISQMTKLNTTNAFSMVEDGVPSAAATYYGVKLFSYLGINIDLDYDQIAVFLLTLFDNETGGFVSSPESNQATPFDTYYVIMTLAEMNRLALLTRTQELAVIDYLEGLYVDEPIFEKHYGGYSMSQDIPSSLIALTYYCTFVLSQFEDVELPEQTKTWLLGRQDPRTYGFAEIPGDNSQTGATAITSFYAVSVLELYGASFDDHVWVLEIDPVTIGIIIALVVLVLAGIGYAIYYRRTQ